MKQGVFWVVDDKLLAFPFGTVDTQDGIAKSGTTYNHKRLWEEIKPHKCNKAYNYYPRGRVEINTHNKVFIYMNPNVSENLISEIMAAFELTEEPEIRMDCSRHYRCYLDEGYIPDY